MSLSRNVRSALRRPGSILAYTLCWGSLTLLLAWRSVAQDVPGDKAGFTEYVAGRLRTEAGDSTVAVKAPLTLQLGSLQVNLDRVFSFCHRNANGCPTEVSTFVRGAAEVYKAQSAPITRDAIRAVVRTTQYVQQVQNSLKPDAPRLLPMPFVEGLVVLPVLDSAAAMRFINTNDLKSLGMSEQEVQLMAITNLREAVNLKPLMTIAKVAGPGLIGQLAGDSFYPSRLALLDTWKALADAQGGKLIVAVPATDAVFYIGDDSRVAIDALRTLTRNILVKAPHPLSGILLRWTPSGWEIIS